jgi:hypothetical protein
MPLERGGNCLVFSIIFAWSSEYLALWNISSNLIFEAFNYYTISATENWIIFVDSISTELNIEIAIVISDLSPA